MTLIKLKTTTEETIDRRQALSSKLATRVYCTLSVTYIEGATLNIILLVRQY